MPRTDEFLLEKFYKALRREQKKALKTGEPIIFAIEVGADPVFIRKFRQMIRETNQDNFRKGKLGYGEVKSLKNGIMKVAYHPYKPPLGN